MTITSWEILLVEDDSAVAKSLVSGLEKEGYRVTWRANGEDGIRYTSQHSPNLIILDVRLPDVSGVDVCARLRRMGLRQPILFLTVQGDELDKVLGLEMGADDYMTKPYSLRELLSRLRALLRRAYGDLSNAGNSSGLYYIGDLTVDPLSGKASRGDKPINLTPTEFRLLAYLARNAGLVLTRAQIIEAVWGFSTDAESEQMVNVHIRRLREKVEFDPSQPQLILTVPGIGYRLERS